MNENMQQFCVHIDRQTVKELRIRAAIRDMFTQDLVIEILHDYVKKKPRILK